MLRTKMEMGNLNFDPAKNNFPQMLRTKMGIRTRDSDLTEMLYLHENSYTVVAFVLVDELWKHSIICRLLVQKWKKWRPIEPSCQ